MAYETTQFRRTSRSKGTSRIPEDRQAAAGHAPADVQLRREALQVGDCHRTGVRVCLLCHLAGILVVHQDADGRLYRATDTGGEPAVPVAGTDLVQAGAYPLLRHCLFLHLQPSDD